LVPGLLKRGRDSKQKKRKLNLVALVLGRRSQYHVGKRVHGITEEYKGRKKKGRGGIGQKARDGGKRAGGKTK